MMRPDGMCFSEFLNDLFARIAALAIWMPVTAATDAILNIKYQVVAWARSYSHWDGVHAQGLARLPCDHMIGARGVPAHPEAANQLSFLIVESETASKHDHASDRLAHQRIIRLS